MAKESTRTKEQLKELQSKSLNEKIQITTARIIEWYEHYDGNVVVSFSGGKDSSVLFDIARKIYPNIKAVYIDTGLEYPELREFVKTFDNVDWVRPKMQFRRVIEKYGYPFISKEASECIHGARVFIKKYLALTERERESNDNKLPYRYFYDKLCGQGKYDSQSVANSPLNYEELSNLAKEKGTARFKMVMGVYPPKNKSYDMSLYSQKRWQFFLDAPFEVSNQCCNVMKKNPSHDYQKKTGAKMMTAQLAEESRLRKASWMKNGCNGFDMKRPISNPMAFWTEQDVLEYIATKNLPICSVYGEIIKDEKGKWVTTGCDRTGCMFCGYGCHLEKSGEGRFERMKTTHPKQYEWIMKPWNEGGLGYREIIDWINEHGGTNIRY